MTPRWKTVLKWFFAGWFVFLQASAIRDALHRPAEARELAQCKASRTERARELDGCLNAYQTLDESHTEEILRLQGCSCMCPSGPDNFAQEQRCLDIVMSPRPRR